MNESIESVTFDFKKMTIYIALTEMSNCQRQNGRIKSLLGSEGPPVEIVECCNLMLRADEISL